MNQGDIVARIIENGYIKECLEERTYRDNGFCKLSARRIGIPCQYLDRSEVRFVRFYANKGLPCYGCKQEE